MEFDRGEGRDYAVAGDADIGRVGAGPYRVRKLEQGERLDENVSVLSNILLICYVVIG